MFMPRNGQLGMETMGNVIGTCNDDTYTIDGPFHQIDRTTSDDAESQPRSSAHNSLPYIIGPSGDVVTLADLPSPRVTRWVIRRKAEVVLAVHAGLLSREEACSRYRLTVEEFLSWQRSIERHGLLGLRTTQLQQYRYGDSR
jgi:hypothetical protein